MTTILHGFSGECSCCIELRKEMKRLRAQTTWQPIESAPMDGTEVWLTDGKYKRSGYWAKRVNAWSMDIAGGPIAPPTQWAPLPLPYAPTTERA